MKAIEVQSNLPGLPLVWQETRDPAFGPDEVLVDIHAASLNRADLQQRLVAVKFDKFSFESGYHFRSIL